MKIHKLSDVKSKSIGKGTTIWQYCVIMKEAKIGKNCNICSHCFIENNVQIGNRVTIKNGVRLFNSIKIEDDVFIGPNVTFTNDLYPKSIRLQKKKIKFPLTIIKKGASIGGGVCILPGVKIGRNAIIGAGSVVAENVKDNAVVYGNKAKQRKLKKFKF